MKERKWSISKNTKIFKLK